jgi:uncharacterized membrane protein
MENASQPVSYVMMGLMLCFTTGLSLAMSLGFLLYVCLCMAFWCLLGIGFSLGACLWSMLALLLYSLQSLLAGFWLMIRSKTPQQRDQTKGFSHNSSTSASKV